MAETYDRVRPGYPPQLFDDLLAHAGMPTAARALEIGAGTGKATVALAARGIELVCLEPDPSMAEVGRRNCAPYAHVAFVAAGFEHWDLGSSRFHLVFSGQAWHWVDPEVRVDRAAEALVPGGTLALFWNRPVWRPSPLLVALDEVYSAHAPEMARGSGFVRPEPARNDEPGDDEPGDDEPGDDEPGDDEPGEDEQAAQIAASGLFEGVETRTYGWVENYSAQRYAELLSTHSDHRMLPDAPRDALLDAIGRIVDAAGGIAVEYATELYLARRA